MQTIGRNYKMNKLKAFITKTIESVGTFIYVAIIGIAGLFSHKCEIRDECLKCNYSIEESFDIMEIDVYNYNSEGMPKDYKEKFRYRCTPYSNLSHCLGDSVYNDQERKILRQCKETKDTIMKLNGNSIGGAHHSKRIHEYIQCSNTIDSISQVNFPFKPEKRIYFKKKNRNYKYGLTKKSDVWDHIQFIECQTLSDTLTFTFLPNKWYLIDFSNQAHYIDRLFFKFKEDGDIEQQHLNYVQYN